jgi:hypothetical protein
MKHSLIGLLSQLEQKVLSNPVPLLTTCRSDARDCRLPPPRLSAILSPTIRRRMRGTPAEFGLLSILSIGAENLRRFDGDAQHI